MENNVNSIMKNECCGCTGCYSICPKNAIEMVRDDEGFLYPIIDKEKCVNCGLCLKVCKEKSIISNYKSLFVYAAKNKDKNVLKRSSSGGISYSLGKYFIENGGVVYGTIYDSNHKVIVEREDSIDGLEKLYGSKYVQTNPKNTFRKVSNDLKDGKMVLYISTSCIISGLKIYLKYRGINQDNLCTVDLICHGVPSPKLFDDYINFLKNKYDFDHFSFRTKELPWGYGSKNYGCTIYLKNGKKIVDSIDARLFLQVFFSNYALRPYCHKCDFARVNKPSDFTIADYWGLKDVHPDFFDENGVSAVIVNTEKGNKIFDKLSDIEFLDSSIDNVRIKQFNLSKPSPMKDGREDFWNLYYEKGFLAVCKKYLNYTFKRKIIFRLKRILIILKSMER